MLGKVVFVDHVSLRESCRLGWPWCAPRTLLVVKGWALAEGAGQGGGTQTVPVPPTQSSAL
ncbi:hypothetical protein MDS_0196 [Ectopseudomonas mendocina NK-01]|nr:hypothetical protein MDS_0196 [Pseudomonas mendocina NK-01]